MQRRSKGVRKRYNAIGAALDLHLIYTASSRCGVQVLCGCDNGQQDVPTVKYLTHWPLSDLDAILKMQFSILFYWLFFFFFFFFSRSSNDNAPKWMPWDLTDDKSILVQVMAWCGQATSHYLSQCWPSSTSPYGITRPQWVNIRHTIPKT